MDQNNQQLNIETPSEANASLEGATIEKRKRIKIWDVILWIIIVALAIAVFIRAFVVSRVTVSGESMTADYYNSESSDYYNPSLTYHNGDTVKVNKMAKPKRGEVVVFYKKPIKSKFLALFASGDSTEPGGEYYKLIKRVVALGGDKLWIEHIESNKYRLVVETAEGVVLHEDYYEKDKQKLDVDCFILYDKEIGGLGCLKGTTQENPLTIEDGYFFAIGDNRGNSDDSRGDLGPVPLSQIFGVVV